MKSSDKSRLKPRFSWIGMIVAIAVAAAMWYVVSQRGRIEGEVAVNVTYNDIPPDLIVTKGLVNTLSVRLRGPEALMSAILHKRLTYAISLANITNGYNFVPIPSEHLSPELRAFDIIDVHPPYIELTAGIVKERVVPVEVEFEPPIPEEEYRVEPIKITPSRVTLRGPENVIMVKELDKRVAKVQLDQLVPGPHDRPVQLYTPSFVTASPSSVRVAFTITAIKETISRRRSVHIAQDATHHYSVEPKEVELKVEVSVAQAKSRNYLDGIKASVTPPALEPGESRKVKVDIELPEGAKLLSSSPEEVKITRLKK